MIENQKEQRLKEIESKLIKPVLKTSLIHFVKKIIKRPLALFFTIFVFIITSLSIISILIQKQNISHQTSTSENIQWKTSRIPPVDLLPTCDTDIDFSIIFSKKKKNVVEKWKIENGKRVLISQWSRDEKRDLSGFWAAKGAKELSINPDYYSVPGYSSLYLLKERQQLIYQTKRDEIITNVRFYPETEVGCNCIYFSILNSSPEENINYILDVYKYDVDNQQKTNIAHFESIIGTKMTGIGTKMFKGEIPVFAKVFGKGRYLIIGQSPLTGGRGGCGAGLAEIYDLETKKFLNLPYTDDIACGSKHLFKESSSEFYLFEHPILIMDSPPKGSKIELYHGNLSKNGLTGPHNFIGEIKIDSNSWLWEIYGLDSKKQDVYARVGPEDNQPKKIMIISIADGISLQTVFDFSAFPYHFFTKGFSPDRQLLVGQTYIDNQGEFQKQYEQYEPEERAGDALILIDLQNQCWLEIDRHLGPWGIYLDVKI